MLQRSLVHIVRYPGLSLFVIVVPVLFLLGFVFVFGGAIGAGLPNGGGDGQAAYLEYVVPGVIAMTIGGGCGGAAIAIAMDMHEGIIARFRTMAISRGAVLFGHVLGNTIQVLIAVVLVFAVSLAIGFRPTTGPLEWLAALGLIVLVSLAITWLGVGMGMASKSVETASNWPLLITFLPFLGSGFVPTDSMPVWLQWFAAYQPFTPWIETLRGLLLGTPIGWSGLLAIGWALLIILIGYAWSLSLYNRSLFAEWLAIERTAEVNTARWGSTRIRAVPGG